MAEPWEDEGSHRPVPLVFYAKLSIVARPARPPILPPALRTGAPFSHKGRRDALGRRA